MRLRALFIVAAAGSALLSAQAVEASTASSSVKATAAWSGRANASSTIPVASYTASPSPIAPAGSLAPTTPVTITVTAYLSSGAVDPNAFIWISFGSTYPPGNATLTVHSTVLNTHYFNPTVYEYRVNSAGQITMTFTAGNPSPHKAGQVGFTAESRGDNPQHAVPGVVYG